MASDKYNEYLKRHEERYNKYVKDEVTEEEVNQWLKQAQETATNFKSGDTSKYTTTYGSDTSSKAKNLLSNADKVWKYLYNHKDEYKDGDKLRSQFSALRGGLTRINSHIDGVNEYYSQWETEGDYFGHLMTNTSDKMDNDSVSTRQNAYTSINDRIKQIDDEITKIPMGYSASGAAPLSKYKDKYDELTAEKERLMTYVRKYERGGNKDKDALFLENATKEDYEEKSANRDFGNSTYDDYVKYDTYKYGGNIHDKETGEYTRIEMSPENAQVAENMQLSINDPLGFYLSFRNGGAESNYHPDSPMSSTEVENVIMDGHAGNWSQLQEEEIDMYYYLLNDQGQESALSFLKGLSSELSYRSTEEYKEYLKDASAVDKIFWNVVSVPQNIIGGAVAFADDAAHIITGREIDPYNGAHGMKNQADATRSVTAEELVELTNGGEFLGMNAGDVYQALMSGADSFVGANVFGSAYMGFMVAGAASSGAKDLYDRGASTGQIISGAFINGAAEWLGEKIPLDNFLKMKGSTKGLKDLIAKALMQGGYEMGGEMITEITNIFGEAINLRSESEWAKLLEENEGAFLETVKELATDKVWKAGAGGFISGMLMGGTQTTADYAQNQSVFKKEGKSIIESGGVDALKNLALDMAGEQKGISNFAQKMALKKQANKVSSEVYEGEGLGGRISAAVKNSRNAKAVGRLSATVQETITDNTISQITKDLRKDGMSAKEATKIADEFLSVVENGGEFSTELQDAIDKSLEDGTALGKTWASVFGKDSTVTARVGRYNLARQGIEVDSKGELTEEGEKAVTKKINDKLGITGTVETEAEEFEVNADGENIVKSSGNAIETLAFVDTDDGVKIKVSDTESVSASDVSYKDGSTAVIFSAVTSLGADAKASNEIASMFSGITDEKQAKAIGSDMALAYKYGKMKYGESYLAKLDSLTPQQAKVIYNKGREHTILHRDAEDAKIKSAVEQAKKDNKTAKNTAKKVGNLVLANGISTDSKSRTDLQNANLMVADVMSKLTGTEIYVGQSSVGRDGKRTWSLPDGTEIGANGLYLPGRVYLDLNAGTFGEGVLIETLGHELGHHIKRYNPEAFAKIADYLMESFEANGYDVRGMIQKEIDKIKAREARLKAEAKRLGKTYEAKTEQEIEAEAHEEFVCQAFVGMLQDGTVAKSLADLKKNDYSVWQVIMDAIKNLLDKWGLVIKEYDGRELSTEEGQALSKMKDVFKNVQQMYTEALQGATENFEAIGISIDADTNSVSPMLSERTWRESEYVQERDKAAWAIKTSLGVDLKTAYQYIDDINSVARLIADDRVRLDYEPNLDVGASVLKPNSEYKWSVDMSTLCAKRLLFTGTFDAIQRALPNTVFDSEDIVGLREMMQKRNLEVACGICYVESTRREIGRITQEFIDRYKVAQKSGKPISRINSKGEEVVLKSGGRTFNADKSYTPNLGELNTTDIDFVKRDHREVYDAYLAFMNARGQAKPKLLETRAEYKGEILKHFKSKSAVNARNNAGGLRLQSFSDFEVPHLIDMMQVVMDMARVGLKSQAYTKVPTFAEAFGNTGVKINLSLIAKDSGLDADGNLIFDDVEGINHEEAFRLRDKFSKNVGTILVGKNDAHIIAAMADPRIDFIIPFHKSSWKESLYDALGLTGYDDYTDFQNEKAIDGSSIKNYDPSEYWDFSKSGDENAQIYLQKCREDGRIPKFPQFQGYPGYWKLLIDFKMYDNNGVGSPQEVVKPIFDEATNAKILSEYKGGHRSLPVAKDVVDDFVKDYKARKSDVIGRNVKEQASNFHYSNLSADDYYLNGKIYSYDFLVAQKEMTKVELPKTGYLADKRGKIDDEKVLAEGIKNALSEGTERGGKIYVKNSYTGRELRIDNSTIKHGLDGTYNRHLTNARIGSVIGSVVKNAIPINGLKNTSSKAIGTYAMVSYCYDSQGRQFVAIITVEQHTGNVDDFELYDVAHAVSGRQKKGSQVDTKSQGVNPIEATTISIKDLLRVVNGTHQSILSDDVLLNLGETRNPQGSYADKVLFQERDTAPTFYSKMGKVIDDIKPLKMGANGVVPYLKGKGVKNEELKWSGIEVFLEGKKSVTKEELQEFAMGNQLQIEEMTRSTNEAAYNELNDLWEDYFYKPLVNDFDLESGGFDGTKVKVELSYMEDNGYDMPPQDVQDRMVELADSFGIPTKWDEYVLKGGSNYREITFKMPNSTYTNQAMQAHWGKDAEGILAHARIQDFDVNGEKMLFVEEIQSDWHNAGQKYGYGDNAEALENARLKQKELKAEYDSYGKQQDALREKRYREIDDYEYQVEMRRLVEKETEVLNELQRVNTVVDNLEKGRSGSAPDAPFRSNYQEYVLKRLIRMAAEEGYDSIGWTTSQIQSDRWSDQYAEGYRIEYDQDIPKFLRKYGKQWGATVGKIALPSLKQNITLYDINRQEEYDSFTKWQNAVERELKAQGANLRGLKYESDDRYWIAFDRVSGTEYDRAEIRQSPNEVWSMPITDSMKNSVLYEGQPMFQERESEFSNRTLLANALSSVAQSAEEKQRLNEYKSKIRLIDGEQKKLEEINQQMTEIMFSKGKRSAEDQKKLDDLKTDARLTASRINTYDRRLLELEAMSSIKNVLKREKDAVRKRERQRARDALAELRKEKNAKLDAVIKQNRETRQKAVDKARETRDKRDARAKLQKLVLETSKWISYPSKTDVKCPDVLKEPYAKFLSSIDLSSKRLLDGGDPTKNDLRVSSAMDSLATAIEKVRLAQDPNVSTDNMLDSGYLDLPQNFVEILREMAENTKNMMVDGDHIVNSMTSDEIRKLSKLIRTLNHSIREMSTLYANLRFANVEALGDHSVTFLDDLGETKETKAINDFITWDNALPYHTFKRFGEGGESIFEELMDAQDKLAYRAAEIFAFKDKTWTDKEAKSWGEDTHTIELPSGNSLTLTSADAMSIYCLYQREQAVPHLTGGGVRVVGAKKGSKQAKDSRSTLTFDDIQAIISSLSDRQIAVANAIQDFMSTTCADWGNEISMKRFLTKEFTEKKYFPIESNDENLDTKDPQAQQSDLYRLLNISATKPTVQGANNEVIIRNIFDVFTNHSSDMARLNAYGMALLDYMKWLNYKEKSVNEQGQIKVKGVRKSMVNAYGEKAKSYVINLIKDINGRSSDGGDHAWLMKMTRAAKTASVGNNLRVAILQMTAYPRAGMVLSQKSLTLGLTKVPKINMAKKYCGIALWKSFGFYDTNIARSIEDQIKGATNIRQKIIELSLKGAEYGDAITWGCLWNACEYEVAETTSHKVGTEEFYQEVGKKLREVVYATQVVDSTLTRSQIMRNKSGLTQTATAFMSEATVSANILMDAGFQFHMEKRRTGSAKLAWKKTGKRICKAIAIYSTGQLLSACIEALMDAYRDDDDEEFKDKFIDAFIENAITDIIPFNKIPIISDIAGLILSKLGVGFFSSDRLDTTWLSHIANAYDAWAEIFSGKETSKTTYNAIYKTTQALSSVTGVSVSGLMREVVTLWNNTAGAYDKTLKVKSYKRTTAELGQELYEAIVSGDDRQAESLKAEFDDDKSADNAIKKAIYENDPIAIETASEYINGNLRAYESAVDELVGKGFDRNVSADAIQAIVSKVKSAAQSQADGETEEYNEKVQELIDLGYDEEQLLKDIKTIDADPTDDTEKAESIYRKDDYITALESGDTAMANTIKDDIISTEMANGESREDAEEKVKGYEKPYIKESYVDGRTSTTKATSWLKANEDMTDDEAYWELKKWKVSAEHKGEDGYSYSKYNEFLDAVESGDTITMNRCKSEFLTHPNGNTNKEVLADVASSITRKYKPLYIEASPSERARLKQKLLNAYTLLGYSWYNKSKDIDKWLKD